MCRFSLLDNRKTGRPNLCLIYRVPVARWGEGVTARRDQLRKPEQQVSAEVKCVASKRQGEEARWRRRTRYTCLVLMLKLVEKLVVNRDVVPRRRGRQYNGDGQVVGGLLFARTTRPSPRSSSAASAIPAILRVTVHSCTLSPPYRHRPEKGARIPGVTILYA